MEAGHLSNKQRHHESLQQAHEECQHKLKAAQAKLAELNNMRDQYVERYNTNKYDLDRLNGQGEYQTPNAKKTEALCWQDHEKIVALNEDIKAQTEKIEQLQREEEKLAERLQDNAYYAEKEAPTQGELNFPTHESPPSPSPAEIPAQTQPVQREDVADVEHDEPELPGLNDDEHQHTL